MKKGLNIFVFIFGTISLVISLVLFYNMGVFVDEFNTTPSVVCGGDFWLYMDWLRLFLLAVITLLSGINLVKKQKK